MGRLGWGDSSRLAHVCSFPDPRPQEKVAGGHEGRQSKGRLRGPGTSTALTRVIKVAGGRWGNFLPPRWINPTASNAVPVLFVLLFEEK